VVGLLDVLPPATLQPEELVASWTAHGPDPRPATVIGLGASGPVEVDLVRDGPHALVAGTTGAGKSELLRSLVVGLAVSQSPHDLTFVLVDYKGGSAFDACRELPHVVGVVTDLDDGLANRVLCSLGAELTRREQLLRDAGAGDLAAYRRLPAHEPVPRLVLVVDEFAGLAGERPAFLASLVAIAQRGRSLGVHLVLATQRPAGVVSDDIRANTNLRIALRVQDAADSTEVVGDPSASTLPRARPGRATARFGLGELVPLQVACGSVPLPALDAQQVERVDDGRETDDDRPTVLATVVRAIGEAAAAHGSRAPAKPWVDRLPEILPASALPQGAIALVDDPGRQRRFPFSWERTAGHLVVIGAVGSGTTATLRTAALAAAATTAPQRLHLYAVDNGAAGLATLADLPHCGGIIGATERERQLRLLDRLDVELDERCSAAGGARPDVVVVIDDVVGFRRALDDSGEHDATAMLDRVLATGPRVGIVVAVGASSDAGLPRALDGTVASCLTLRRSAADHNTFPAGARRMPPGRGVELRSGLELQIAHHADAEVAVADVARMWPATDVELRPAPVRTLPAVVAPADLPPPTATGTAWSLPLGIDDATLEPALLHLHRGDHLLVSGPARSGRTSTLRLIADALRHARPDAVIAALGFRGTAPPGAITADTVADLTVHDSRHLVVVLDDAELIEDPGGVLGALVAGRDAIVVAAGRADALRSAYGHWTAALRRQRRGIVLWPTADVDGDVLGVVLPRQRVLRQPAGRGYVVADGDVRRVQLADAQLAEAELVNGLADARYVDV
jgi:S-DNA-T family DNA segregation ATPase FtsK/SpoIIIE